MQRHGDTVRRDVDPLDEEPQDARLLAGLDPEPLLEALNASAGANFATQTTIGRHVLSRGFGSGLPLDSLLADLQQALDVARDAETPAPLSAVAREIWATARLALGPGQDHTRLVRWLEQITKTEFPR